VKRFFQKIKALMLLLDEIDNISGEINQVKNAGAAVNELLNQVIELRRVVKRFDDLTEKVRLLEIGLKETNPGLNL
jgi:hypothetical protein